MEKFLLGLRTIIFLIHVVGHVQSVGEVTDEWRNVFCQKSNPELFKDLSACLKLESMFVQNACKRCALMASSTSKGDLALFLTEACRDNSLFEKFDDCFSVYEADENFAKEASHNDQTQYCYEQIVDRYDLASEILNPNATSPKPLE